MKIRTILGASMLLLVSMQVNAALMVNSWDLMVLARDEEGVPSTIVNDNTVSNIFSETKIPDSGATASGYLSMNINPVPVPAAIWLFGTGLIGLVGFGKRWKAA